MDSIHRLILLLREQIPRQTWLDHYLLLSSGERLFSHNRYKVRFFMKRCKQSVKSMTTFPLLYYKAHTYGGEWPLLLSVVVEPWKKEGILESCVRAS